jgi:hypothetical protein
MARTGTALPFLPIPSCAEVKNEWMYTSTPLVCVQVTEGEEFDIFLPAYGKPGFSYVSTKIAIS